jgi:archaellum component FlaC
LKVIFLSDKIKILRNYFDFSAPSSYNEMLDQSKKILVELEKLQSIDDKEWDVIMGKMEKFENQLNNITMFFESRLSYTQHELIMDIQDNLERLEKNYGASKKLRRDLFSKINEEFYELMIEEMTSILENLLELDKTRKHLTSYGEKYDEELY